MEADFVKLLSTEDDFDLCNGVFVKIGDQHNNIIDADKYTADERTVVLVWQASGIIDNGGFEHLFSGDFSGDPGYRLTAQAFETIGCEQAATAFREALSMYPDGRLPEDIDARYKIHMLTPKSTRDEIDGRFFHAGKEIQRRLATYIRAHRQAFAHLE